MAAQRKAATALLGLLGALCAGVAGGAVPATAEGDVVAFNVGVVVEVDAAGKPQKVEASPDLPEAIRSFVEKRVRTWQYLPARIDGVVQPARTYVAVRACAVPVGGGYRLGVDFKGNGPRTAADRPLAPPRYPPLAQRSGTSAEFMLVLRVEPDGRATIDRIERAEIAGRPGAGEFEPALRQWVRTIRFEPEQVAGKPVRGLVRVPVDFRPSGGETVAAMREERQATAKDSTECRMAAGGRDLAPIAVESVVTVIAPPAG
jgi:TonB family protein